MFQVSLQSKAQHCLHALRVIPMTAKMAEADSIVLQSDARRIEGMQGCSPPLMLDADMAKPIDRGYQWCAMYKRVDRSQCPY